MSSYVRFGNTAHINDDDDDEQQRSRVESIAGCTLSFHDIHYTVQIKTGSCKKGNQFEEKTILNGVSGIFSPGMNAILGPTGGGKTSLLDVLAGRKDPYGLDGNVLINGHPLPDDFRLISGYVVQDDVVMSTLTVRENLAFSAALRLPSNVTKNARAERVKEVIAELGLKACADTRIGNPFRRGVSGGERKRTNIGMELIIRPEILFLDEPTTGLDASTAKAVIALLSRLTRKGRCIVFSIHQPRYSIYRLIDTLHLLSKGETVYHGPANETLEYFAEMGHTCDRYNNPPDFFLDLIHQDETFVRDNDDIMSLPTAGMKDVCEARVNNNAKKTSISLANQFKNSIYERQIQEQLTQTYDRYRGVKEVTTERTNYRTSAIFQYIYICGRNSKNVWRNPRVSSGQIMVMAIFALIVGGIYFQLDDSATTGIQNRVGALFFIVVNMVFGNTSAVEPFIAERVTFVHESASGFYRVSSYFFAKVTADLIPVRFIPTTIFACISYWMIGFRPDVVSFFLFLLTLLTTSFAAVSIAFMVGASVRSVGLANVYVGPCYVMMMIFGGLLVSIASLPKWLQYIQYLSIVRYSMNSLYINELSGRTFCDPPKNGTVQKCVSGDDYLESQGIDYSEWGFWQNQVALVAVIIAFLFLTYVQLRRMPKLK